jgi:hypothetical protein
MNIPVLIKLEMSMSWYFYIFALSLIQPTKTFNVWKANISFCMLNTVLHYHIHWFGISNLEG